MFSRSAHDVAPSPAKAEKIGPYTLSSIIASGSLATIHRAQLAPIGGAEGGVCAVKRLQRHHLDDAELRALLLATGRAAMTVSTPDVVRTLVVHEDPEPFLVMEYIDGANLHELMRTAASPHLARLALPVLLDVLDGLQALHQPRSGSGNAAGLVHGAPCARHIVVGRDGLGRLLDLSHAIGPELPWSPRRDERLIPSEMAPEQALAPAHVDVRCDLFIVGSVLWQVLTGHNLFESGDARASLQSMLRKPIPSPSEAGATAGRDFDRICLRALQRSRADRYGSAAEMAAALRDAMQRAGLAATREEIGGLVSSVATRASRARVGTLTATRTTTFGFAEVQAALGNAAPDIRHARPAERAPQRGAQPAARARSLPAIDRVPPAQTQSALVRADRPSNKVEAKATLTIGTFEASADSEFDASFVDASLALAPASSALATAPTEEIMAIESGLALAGGERVLASPAPVGMGLSARPSMHAPVRAARDDWEDAGELVSLLDPPTAWKELLPSKPPARRKARPAPVNKRAMAAGIAIALGVPAIGLYWSSGLPAAPEEAPQAQPVPAAADVQEAAVQNSTLEALMRDGSSERSAGGTPKVAPRAPDLQHKESRAAADAARKPQPAAVARKEPATRAEPKANAPQARRAQRPSKPPAEGVPINPY
jgi:hypothetical protein